MKAQPDLDQVRTEVAAIRAAAERVRRSSAGFPAIDRNVGRLLASVKMLELSVPEIPPDG